MLGNITGTRFAWNKEEIYRELNRLTVEEHDEDQASKKLDYTKELVISRDFTLSDLSSTLRRHLSSFFAGKDVLEIGPGAEDILYEILLPSLDGQLPLWYALDVNPQVIQATSKKYASSEKFKPILGTAREIHFEEDKFDVVCGMCSLDSIIDFEKVISEIYRVLKPGGYLIHVQDLPPCHTTLVCLLANDPQLPEKEDVVFYDLRVDGEGGVTHVQFPGQDPIQSHQYLHQSLEREFRGRGFQTQAIGLRKYSMNEAELYALANSILGQKWTSLSQRDGYKPHYSFLIMQKE